MCNRKSTLQGKRNDESFQEVFDKAVGMVDSLGIESIQIPHQRKPPSRYTGGVSKHAVLSTVVHYRTEFYKMLDSVDVQLRDRFNQPDLDVLQK